MTFFEMVTLAAVCVVAQQPAVTCINAPPTTAETTTIIEPNFTGEATDVDLSAQAALVWDEQTGKVLYEKNARTQRPIASISKLLSALSIRQLLPPNQMVVIPPTVRASQVAGANIRLPIGEHTSVQHLLEAGMIASANDAMVTLAVAAKNSENDFVDFANKYAVTLGLNNTKLANSTGLSKAGQYSTAYDVRKMMTLASRDPVLSPLLSQERGVLQTIEGSQRTYKSTDELLGTYLPILAAKTGYTTEAGENLVIITTGNKGQRIGAVILGSTARFQDMKVLVEWIWRNYTWQ